MADFKLIRFDTGEFEFNEADFTLSPPSEYTDVSHKPKTSRLLYKGEKCSIRFPKQVGYGLSEFKSTKPGENGSFTFTYIKRDETDEERRFNKFIDKFQTWYKKEVQKIAEAELQARKKKLKPILSEKLATDLKTDDSTIKPFFVDAKDKDKNIDKSKKQRHYVKFKLSKSGAPICDVYNFNGKNLLPKDIVSTDIDKKIGEYILEVKIKGFFYDVKEQYNAFLQTEGSVVCYRKSPTRDPKALLGVDFKEENDTEKEKEDAKSDNENEDDSIEQEMLEKMRLNK